MAVTIIPSTRISPIAIPTIVRYDVMGLFAHWKTYGVSAVRQTPGPDVACTGTPGSPRTAPRRSGRRGWPSRRAARHGVSADVDGVVGVKVAVEHGKDVRHSPRKERELEVRRPTDDQVEDVERTCKRRTAALHRGCHRLNSSAASSARPAACRPRGIAAGAPRLLMRRAGTGRLRVVCGSTA